MGWRAGTGEEHRRNTFSEERLLDSTYPGATDGRVFVNKPQARTRTMSHPRRMISSTNSSQNDLAHPEPQRQLRRRDARTDQRKELPPGTALYKRAFLIPPQMYDSLGQLLMDSNIAGRTWLERVYSNAWRFQVKADFVRNRAINGSSIISANTPLAAYLGQVHVEEDPTRPGIAYRQGLTMGSRGYGGVTRVYIEGERTVFEHPGDGVDGEGIIFNAAGFRQQCENSNMKLLWTRPLEAEQHPSDCMWILVAFTRREISEGEELTIDRNEAAGNNYGFLHEPKDSDLIISMFPRNVRCCDCGSGNNACPYDRVYLQPALTPEQWEQYEAAVTLKRNTDQRAADRRMNDGELAGQASQEHGESNNLELDKIQGTAHELRSTDRKSNSLDNESNEPISQTKGGRSVQQGRSSAYELAEEANTNGRKLCPNDPEPRGLEVGRSGAESSLIDGVRCHLEPSTWARARLSPKTLVPTLMDVATACRHSVDSHWERLTKLQKRAIIEERGSETLLEKGDGLFPAIRIMTTENQSQQGMPGIPDLTSLFQATVMPSCLQQASRAKYQGLWRAYVTFAIAHGDLRILIPSQKPTVYAWAQELLMMGASAAYIENSLSAIQSRHHSYGFRPPLSQKFEFRNLSKAIASLKGTPKRLFFPVTKEHLRKMLHLRNLTAAQERAVIITSTGTQLCCRVSEIRNFQVCDFLKDHDTAFSSRFRGCAAFRIRKRKQDTRRRGLYPRMFRGTISRMCTIRRIETMMRRNEGKISEQCTKVANPAARCPYCPPLFCSNRRKDGEYQKLGRSQVTEAVKTAYRLIGLDPCRFSGISMRKGGISTAVHHKVSEPMLFLQSGHGSGIAARSYMTPLDPRAEYETALVLRL